MLHTRGVLDNVLLNSRKLLKKMDYFLRVEIIKFKAFLKYLFVQVNDILGKSLFIVPKKYNIDYGHSTIFNKIYPHSSIFYLMDGCSLYVILNVYILHTAIHYYIMYIHTTPFKILRVETLSN